MTRTADIIVIGGGIAGISAASRLARRAKVVVLEAEPHLAYHSTGRSAAIFIRNYGNATLRALNAVAYPELQGAFIGENVLSPRGELLLVREEDEAALAAYLEGADGVEILSPQEALEIVPALRPGAFVEVAKHYYDYPRAIKRKLLRELAPPGMAMVHP